MCAIVGIIGEANHKTLKKMSICQLYRGPDTQKFFINKKHKISIGMNRLAVIDRKNGSQPMFSNSKRYLIVFNGAIYNFKEIKNFLVKKNFNFKTNSDTEVLVNSYSYWGDKCFNYFDGMWAVALYNFSNNSIKISRDYLGQKPLFYTSVGKDKFLFSSQIDGIFKYKYPFEINRLNLKSYYQFGFTPSPNTIYNKLYQVTPGEIISFKKQINRKTFWDLTSGADYNIFFKKDNRFKFEKKFNKILKNYLIADKKPALTLSSGLDSNILRFILKKIGVKLKMFTIGFVSKSFNEIKNLYIDKVKDHNIKIMKSSDIKNIFLKLKKKVSFANSDGSLIPTYFLFNQIKKKTNVCLGGDGGDEIFFGYITFKAFWIAEKLKFIFPNKILMFFNNFTKNLKMSNNYIDNKKKLNLFFKYINYDLSLINSYWLNNLNDDELTKVSGTKRENKDVSKLKKLYKKNKDKMRFCQLYYFKYYLPMILDKIDNASMLNSVENRSPYLNKNLINLTLNTPTKKNFRIFGNKNFLIRLLGKNLPKNYIVKKKHGFGFQKNIILRNKKFILNLVNQDLLSNKNFFLGRYENYLQTNNYENYIWQELILNFTRQNLEIKKNR